MAWYESGSSGDDRLKDAMALAATYGLPKTNTDHHKYGCPITDSTKNQALKLVRTMEAGQILKAMESAPSKLRAWLIFAYGDNLSQMWRDCFSALNYWLVSHAPINATAGKRTRTLKRLMALCLSDSRLRVLGNSPLNELRLQKIMGFGYRDWTNWRRVWFSAHDLLTETDREALGYFHNHAPNFLHAEKT